MNFQFSPRVVVQLTDSGEQPRESWARLSQKNYTRKGPTSSDVVVLDHHTLNLSVKQGSPKCSDTIINQQMRFDTVGKAKDARMRSEIAMLMENLLVDHKNCCLVRFCAMPLCNIPVLINLVVLEVDKLLETSHASLNHIKLEYFDIRKYDVVNLVGRGVIPYVVHKRRIHQRCHFTTTLELHKWLLTEYMGVWSIVQGHENIDFWLSILDDRRQTHHIQFNIVQLYISKMDCDSKVELRNFLENSGSDIKGKHSMLIDNLKEYFSPLHDWKTWLFFDVPGRRNNSIVIEELLTLANAAYAGATTIRERNNLDILRLSSGMDIPIMQLADKDVPIKSINPKWANHRAVIKSTETLSINDYNSLSAWYCKIDENFSNVLSAMEAYYDSKSAEKISKICIDIKNMMRKIDQDSEILAPENSDKLQQNYLLYSETLMAFRKLTFEVEKSSYAEQLKVYLKTKNYELSQNAVRFKIKQLDDCQARVSGTIKFELTALIALKKLILQSKSTIAVE